MVVEGTNTDTDKPMFNILPSRVCPLHPSWTCFQSCGFYTWRDGVGLCAIRAIAEELMSRKVRV